MNSNLKLLPATLLVAVLALAGCGGSGSDDTMPPPPPPPTPEEQCRDDGGIYEDGECKSADDLREEGAQDVADEEKAKAMEAMAKKLRGLLAVAAVAPAATEPASGTPSADVVTALEAAKSADNGEGMEEKAHVMVYNNKGPNIKASVDATSVAVADLMPKLVMGSGFATGSAEIKSHDGGSTVRGSYNGATGGYVCTAAATDCTSRRTKDGIRLLGSWNFNPDAGQKFDVADAHYAEFGWWLDEGITTADAAQVGAWYDVEETSGTEIALSATDAVTGTATYKGQAVGKAAYYHSQSDSNVGGAFTADAELNADFDTNMLGGSITGFDVGGMNPGWSVELVKHAITGTGLAPATATAMTKWTINGTAGDAGGTWSAYFYGTPAKEHQPSGVAGGFQAQYESDGFMVGAFGAER